MRPLPGGQPRTSGTAPRAGRLRYSRAGNRSSADRTACMTYRAVCQRKCNLGAGDRLRRQRRDSRLAHALHRIGHRRAKEPSPVRRAFASVCWAGWMARMLLLHPLGRPQRVRSFARAVFWQAWRRLPPNDRGATVTLTEGPSIWFPAWSRCAMSTVAFGFGDPDQIFLWRYLDGDDVMVDVGANVGTHACVALSRGAQVEAFEPDAAAVAVLERNLAANGSRWRIHRLAVSDRDGVASFSTGLDISNHLVDCDPKGEATTEVQVRRLDSLRESGALPGVTILKTDAEGYDMAVLKGARNILERDHPIVIAEIWDGGPVEQGYLRSLGYEIYQVIGGDGLPSKDHDIQAGNILAIPRGRLSEVLRRLDRAPNVPRRHRVAWGRDQGTEARSGLGTH